MRVVTLQEQVSDVTCTNKYGVTDVREQVTGVSLLELSGGTIVPAGVSGVILHEKMTCRHCVCEPQIS